MQMTSVPRLKHSNAPARPQMATLSKARQRVRTRTSAFFGFAKKLDQLSEDIKELKEEVQEVRSEVNGLKGLVGGAAVVNAGAYLAPVVGFAALANAFGFFDKLK